MKQFYPKFFRYIEICQKSALPYFYTGGFVALYLSKMAATLVGPICVHESTAKYWAIELALWN